MNTSKNEKFIDFITEIGEWEDFLDYYDAVSKNHVENPRLGLLSEEVDDHIARILTEELLVQALQPVQPAERNPNGIKQNSVGRLIRDIPIQPDGNISDPAPEPGSLQFENRKLLVALIYKEPEWRRFGSIPRNLKLIYEKLMKLTRKMREENSDHYKVK